MSFVTHRDNVLDGETCRRLLKNVKSEMLEQVRRDIHDGKFNQHESKTPQLYKLNLLNNVHKKHESKKCNKPKHKHSKSKTQLRQSSTSRNSEKTKKSEKHEICSNANGSSRTTKQYERVEAKHSSMLVKRDIWMTEPVLINTYTKKRIEKKPSETYCPAKSSIELNTYWKTTGTGLPNFQKPWFDDDNKDCLKNTYGNNNNNSSKNWKKTNQSSKNIMQHTNNNPFKAKQDKHCVNTSTICLNDQQMNELGSKIIKAEIMNDTYLAEELKQQLDEARRVASKEVKAKNRIFLTHTDTTGNSRPMFHLERMNDHNGCKQYQNKYLQNYERDENTHYSRCNLQKIYLREKYTTAFDTNREFLNIARKQNNNIDDLHDIFSDHTSKNTCEIDTSRKGKEVEQSIRNQQKMEKALDNCNICIDSPKMQKQFLVSIGQRVYLALPWHIGLQEDHCIIAPIQHILCSTQLDEDAWLEVTAFRKTLTQMFADKKKDVIFYEIANNFYKKPHLTIHCIPIDQSKSEMAPFYFKKAIEESEKEWSINKQLISLKDKCLLKCVPKGLPYFWVNFNMNSGFAHIIEDEDRFPSNFAQEIIAGMLHLESHHWRKLCRKLNNVSKTKVLKNLWEKYN